MTIHDEYIALGIRILDALKPPDITHIHIPSLSPDETKKDEFGFIFLEDGSIGPFYVSLEQTHSRLEQRVASGDRPRTSELPLLLASDSLADRALAIGLFNACSDHLMRRAGFIPGRPGSTTDAHSPQPGETVGMVGYFRPLVEKLLASGCQIMVLERQPKRVERQQGVTVTTDPAALHGCQTLLCTASTLINDSLDELLEAVGPTASFSLIGPTASGLPDVLFKHGITSAGGVHFSSHQALREKLDRQESWGSVGEKYQLTPATYPGMEALLRRI